MPDEYSQTVYKEHLSHTPDIALRRLGPFGSRFFLIEICRSRSAISIILSSVILRICSSFRRCSSSRISFSISSGVSFFFFMAECFVFSVLKVRTFWMLFFSLENSSLYFPIPKKRLLWEL